MKSYQININEFGREPEDLLKNQITAVENVFKSGWFILGKKVKEFEDIWADTIQTSYSVGVANGLDAIELGLIALGIGPGDEVITTSLTAFATSLAILKSGAKPVFADIDPNTGCIDINSIKNLINPKTRALIAVHIYGRSCDISKLNNLCIKEKIFFIEDCAQAHGAIYNHSYVGSFGSFGAWSFYPTKNLGAIGDAGAITSNDSSLIEKIRYLRNYGQTEKYKHDFKGANSRLDELQAAILIERLKCLNKWTLRRREIANKYWESIDNPKIKLLEKPENKLEHVHHLFIALTEKRDYFLSYLKNKGINSLIHYPIPNHKQKVFKNEDFRNFKLDKVEEFCSKCISLPINPYLTNDEVNFVINACNEY